MNTSTEFPHVNTYLRNFRMSIFGSFTIGGVFFELGSALLSPPPILLVSTTKFGSEAGVAEWALSALGVAVAAGVVSITVAAGDNASSVGCWVDFEAEAVAGAATGSAWVTPSCFNSGAFTASARTGFFFRPGSFIRIPGAFLDTSF